MSKSSLVHHYDDPRDAVTAPHKFMALTHYYVDRWLPELGERGHIIVTVLRRLGYLDRARDIERGGIEIEQEELATLCGLKLRTLQREFAGDDAGHPLNPALHRFVQREKQYFRNSSGGVVREKTVYVIQMRDPLHPSDQAELEEECDSREKGRSRQYGGNSDPRSRQYGGEARQDDARSRQYGGTSRQYGGYINKGILDSYILKNTSDTPAAVPEDSASLFSEPEKRGEEGTGEEGRGEEKKEPAPLRWEDLTKEAQQPYIDQARQELVAIHAGSGITPKPKLVEVRARNLYAKALGEN